MRFSTAPNFSGCRDRRISIACDTDRARILFGAKGADSF
jgi:hypothetical protein